MENTTTTRDDNGELIAVQSLQKITAIPGLPANAVLSSQNAWSDNKVLPGQKNRSGENFSTQAPEARLNYYIVSKAVTGSFIVRADLSGEDAQFARVNIEKANVAYKVELVRHPNINFRGFYPSNPESFSAAQMRFDVYRDPA
ncbi:hypothetical protein D9M71_85140 [compost metagenome]